MDFVRIAVLALFLTITSMGTVGAQTSAPPTYGAPYTFGPWNDPDSKVAGCQNDEAIVGAPESTIDGAAQAYVDSFNYCSGGEEQCKYTYTAANTPGYALIGYVQLVSSGYCGVSGSNNEPIYGSLPNQTPGANKPGGDGLGGPAPDSSPYIGDPIDASSGNKYQQEDDYLDNRWLTFRRFYNSSTPETEVTEMALGWRHSFDRSLAFSGSPITTIVMSRPDGSTETFTKASGVWTTTLTVDTLTETDNAQGVATGYAVFIGGSRDTETYDTTGKLLQVLGEDGQGATLTYSTSSTQTTIAPTAGLLLSVTDPNGRQLNFTYTSYGYVNQITLPDGGTLKYSYTRDPSTYDYILTSVQYPDTQTRQYGYTAANSDYDFPPALQSITDETGNPYAFTKYDSYSRAYISGFYPTPNNLNNVVSQTQITYNSDGTSTVEYPLGQSATTSFSHTNGINEVATVNQQCGLSCSQPWKTHAYDPNGFPASYTDFNGNVKTTQYSASGLLNTEVDGSGSTNQRTFVTTWNNTLRKPLTRQVQNAQGNLVTETAWVYNPLGDVQAKCEIDPNVAAAASYACSATGTPPAGVRRWVYTYCMAVDTTQCPIIGLLLTVDGPRTDVSDVTTYSYYLVDSATSHHGDLKTVTDALGHVNTFVTYDGAGRATRTMDANGVITDMTYMPRGWLHTKTVRALASGAASSSDATTTIGYTLYGKVASITDPDGVVTSFTYDGAHRLTGITDGQNNKIVYTLDDAGDKTKTVVTAASGTVVKSSSAQYNTIGQVTAVIDGLNNTVLNAGYSDSYDGNGNLTHSADALGFQRELAFDALNRLSSTIDNYNGTDTATANTTSTVQYDALNRVVNVADPTSLNTVATYDGLNDRTKLQSPDTSASTDTFDAAGNRLVHTDAKSVVSTSTYDALNRLIGTKYADTTLNVTYIYDEADSVTGCTGAYALGRLTHVVEASITTAYCYDARGNVVRKRQYANSQLDITYYGYSLADRLLRVQYPSGSHLTYGRDSDGHIQSVALVSASGVSSTAVSSISYLPFGPISSYTLGNGQVVTRTYDANYRLTDLTSPGFTLHLLRDVMGNVSAIGNAAGANPATENYKYDPLYRLSAVTDSGTALESYTYNETGDRLSKTASGLETGTYLYTTGTHQISKIGTNTRANDANGNTTGSMVGGGNTYGFSYNGRNRESLAQLNGATVGTYTYNAMGQRVVKVAATTERYDYDEANKLIGEYGATNRDYIWVGGLPVAVIDNVINGSVTTSTVNYITADQLNTPRAVTNSAGTVIWSWAYKGNPFGEQTPTSSTGYVLNLRYPGQYYDAETATNYNLFRNYEPAIGRYQESDPIGLAGGINTYLYADGNSLYDSDSSGQCPWCVGAAIGAIAGGIAGYETGGWEGALIGGAVGGAIGAVAPWAAATVGDLAAEATGSILAGQIATATSFSGINAVGAVAGTVATNAAEDQPLSQDVGSAAAIGAVAAIPEGAFIASVGTEVTVGSALVSTFTGATGAALTASTLPIQPGQLPVPPTITPVCQ